MNTIMGIQTKKQEDGSWEYPPLQTGMEEAGFEEMGSYFLQIQNTVTQYITTRLILELYKEMEQRPEAWVTKRQWEQEVLYLAGERVEAAT